MLNEGTPITYLDAEPFIIDAKVYYLTFICMILVE